MHLNIIDPWYKKGLKFKCTECGKCCSHTPGYVWLTDEDIDDLALLLQISRKELLRKYTRKVHGKISLIEKKNFDCIFYKDKKCSIYKARPSQCRTFPFWLSNIRAKKNWQEAAKYCEGIDHEEGEIFPLHEIQKVLKTYLKDSENQTKA